MVTLNACVWFGQHILNHMTTSAHTVFTYVDMQFINSLILFFFTCLRMTKHLSIICVWAGSTNSTPVIAIDLLSQPVISRVAHRTFTFEWAYLFGNRVNIKHNTNIKILHKRTLIYQQQEYSHLIIFICLVQAFFILAIFFIPYLNITFVFFDKVVLIDRLILCLLGYINNIYWGHNTNIHETQAQKIQFNLISI